MGNTSHHFDPHAYRRTAHLALQFGLGILSEWRSRIGPSHSNHSVAWDESEAALMLQRRKKLGFFDF